MATPTDSIRLDGPVAIIAGSGRLPEIIATNLKARGNAPVIARVKGECADWAAGFPGFDTRPAEIGGLVAGLKSRGVKYLVLAGGIGSRPMLRDLRLDWITLSSIFTIVRALRRGDDGLLRSLIRFLESHGFEIIGAHQIAPEILARQGVMGRIAPSFADEADIAAALGAALELGLRDAGQGAVAIAGAVAAVEGREGTAAMLERVTELRRVNGIGKGAKGVLVKTVKPMQDMRVDLPSIGPLTVDQAAAAGLAGIALSAGSSIILDLPEVVRRADKAGIFIAGLPLEVDK